MTFSKIPSIDEKTETQSYYDKLYTYSILISSVLYHPHDEKVTNLTFILLHITW